ncbi:MAG: bifunctional [glutamine synthetase] adenylyltransferase/[glutamine synthetase]-adenylyl-L-tyrosine phosphorylase [Nocardioides sp.]
MARDDGRALARTALARWGFADTQAARDRAVAMGEGIEPLLAIIGRTADPDAALINLERLAQALPDGAALLAELVDDEGTAMRLLSVLGASEALADHLVRHPEQWCDLTDSHLGSTRPAAFAVRAHLLQAVGADPLARTPVATLPDQQAMAALRVQYRRLLTRLAARDLAHHLGLDDAAAELSDLAAGTLEAALAIARQRVGERAHDVRLAVIAMGKCGAHELNYISDVDVIFVAEPAEGVDETVALKAGAQLAAHVITVCGDFTAEGTIWEVDAALRPEGKAGPLVRTMSSMRGYYERWAKTWEFQALLKARPVAGDLELGREFVAMVKPMVWSVAERDGFVADVQAMRRRVLDHIPANQAQRQLKLGSGGLRDVEFAVQLLQLVHGRGDDEIHEPTTLSALWALTRRGYVGREDGQAMHEAYEFLRTLEHRIQMHQLRRTHVVPDGEQALRRLGRSMGFFKDPVTELERAWAHHRLEVRRLHEKLFYRPLLSAVARIPGEGARLSTEAAEQRLSALGYADPKAALRHLEALTEGVSRTAAIQRTLLPVLLEWFADAPDPDAGLLGFRRISEALGTTHWYLKTLRDEGQVAERLAKILATSRYATDLLQREPEGVRLLGEDLQPSSAEALTTEMAAAASRQDDHEEAARAIRAIRRRELFRISAGDLDGVISIDDVGLGLTRLTDATLQATLDVSIRSVLAAKSLDSAPTRIAVVAMGRYGGFELSYGSDADVMFVHEPVAGADAHLAAQFAQAVAHELRRLLLLPATDPPLEVDADLRPEGKQGPLVRTLESYAAYYAKWSKVWEAQALLRADAIVGDIGLRERFTALIDPLRYPAEGLSRADLVEIRRIKARVDTERLPRGADPHTHLKLGRGGLADVEWTVQALQLQHAGEHPGLRTPRTLEALAVAVDVDLIAVEDAEQLASAWRLVSRVRNAITLVRGKPGDQLPRDTREKAAVAAVLGYPYGASDEMVNDYLRTTRRAHGVVERIFWG